MLSSLSRGYGSWTGNVETCPPLPAQEPDIPTEYHPWEHRHGITVSPRCKSGPQVVQVAEDGRLDIPKTFATRKGALMLFTAPDDMPQTLQQSPRPSRRKRLRQRDVFDLSLKLKTLERLSLSVLQFGDKLYDKDTSSISDKENKLILNFLHDLSRQDDETDVHSQPGGDLKFYLRDLKRRASFRGFGSGESAQLRTRSAELQELLDELEQAWPRYGQRYHRDSTFMASQSGTDDFFHPTSPTPSLNSTRSFSRARVLSSHKLTASLKSLNQFGKTSSTDVEPDCQSVISDSPLMTGQSYGIFHRSKSAVWLSETSSPAYYAPQRPGTSHSGRSEVQRRLTRDRKLVTSPDPSDDGARKQGMWVEVDSQPDAMSYRSEDGKSYLSGPDSEVRGSDKGRVVTPVKGERVQTPSRGERDAMMMEAASVLSSLVEEEDLDIPVDDVTDVEEERDDGHWPGQEVQERARSVTPARSSKTPVSKPGLTQPLEAPYIGVLNSEEQTSFVEDDMHIPTQKDYLVQMRDASTEPEDLADERTYSRTSTLTPPVPRSITPAASSGHSEQKTQVTDLTSASESRHPMWGQESMSVDKPATDPDTLVGMMGKQEIMDSGLSMDQSPSADDIPPVPQTPSSLSKPLTASPSPPSEPLAASPSPPTEQLASSPSPPTEIAQNISASLIGPDDTAKQVTQSSPKEEEELEIDFHRQEVPGPKRRTKEEPVSVKTDEEMVEEEGDEKKEKEGEKEEETTGLSERVKQELQEREERAARQKEEKENAEQEKQSEEERKKKEAEDKRRAAEERLKAKAEEAARRKEEEQQLAKLKPPSPVPAVETSKKTVKAKKEKKGDKTEKKKEDISGMDSSLDALEKLKIKNQDVDLPMDKIQDFMDSQKKTFTKVDEKKELEVPEHMKEMFARHSDSQVQEALEEEIAKMRLAADNVMGESVLQTEEGEEGLSAEDFAAAQEALKEKLKKAEEQMMDAASPTAPKKPVPASKPKPEKKKGSPSRKKKGLEMSEAAKEREAAKEIKRQEKQKRLEEVMELQKKIKDKEETRKAKEREAKRQAEDLAERMESIRREEEELEQAENDAREQLAAVRKVQREERETRRKQELEKKKQDAIDKREKEKAMMEEGRRKEQEMLDRIADAEMARRLRDEEEAKREEEEILAQERFEAEMKEAQRLAEEEEERLRELEKQAEEEAFQRLVEEKEAAEEKRWQLEQQARRMREEEEKARQEMLEEERRLEEERKQKEAEEEARREEERERLRELQRLEEEARHKMRGELEKRRLWAMKRREHNLEQRANLDAIKQSQGITDPWTYSYFVKWPKESYHRPMGQNPKKKTGPARIKPKAPSGQATTSTTGPSAVDVSAVPK